MAQFSGGKDNKFSPKFTNFHTFIAKFYVPTPSPRGDMQKNATFPEKQNIQEPHPNIIIIIIIIMEHSYQHFIVERVLQNSSNCRDIALRCLVDNQQNTQTSQSDVPTI